MVMVDDCHATLIVGGRPKGRGHTRHAGVIVDILTGTLGRRWAVQSVAISQAPACDDLLRQRARPIDQSQAAGLRL